MGSITHSKLPPIVKLALPRFYNSFHDLISIKHSMTPFDISLIESTFGNILWFGRSKKDYTNFERTARSAFHFLEEGNRVNHKSVALFFTSMIDKVIPAFNNSGKAGSEAKQVPEKDKDTQIKKYFDYYKVMYEGLLPIICAPIVYSFAVSKHIKDRVFLPQDDGKIGLHTLSKMEKHLVYRENRIAIGLNSHVRNAYSHENYKILDNACVELWDKDPNTKKVSWGPEKWTLKQIIELCDQLWVNALGIVCALILYDINNRQIIASRGWSSSVTLPKLRKEELKDVINDLVDELGFYLNELEILESVLSMKLKTKTEGITQQAKLMLGYEDRTQLFEIPIWYEKRRVIDQLVIMLYRLVPYFSTQTEVSIQVVSSENEALGELAIDFDTFSKINIKQINPRTIDSIRNYFRVDTLKQYITFVEKEGLPKWVGTTANSPKPS
jgi:hypothetical protein